MVMMVMMESIPQPGSTKLFLSMSLWVGGGREWRRLRSVGEMNGGEEVDRGGEEKYGVMVMKMMRSLP